MCVLALYEASSASSQQEAQQWVDRTAARVQALATARQAAGGAGAGVPAAVNGGVLQPQANGVSQVHAVRGSGEQPPAPAKQQQQQQQQHAERPAPGAFQLREGRQRYLKNVASCMQVRAWGWIVRVVCVDLDCAVACWDSRGCLFAPSCSCPAGQPPHSLSLPLRCTGPV